MLHQIPPKLGSRRPADLLGQAALLRHLRKVDTRLAVDITRLLTGSIADLLDQYFEQRRAARAAVGLRRDRHVGRAARRPAPVT